jgi:peroxiredoxin
LQGEEIQLSELNKETPVVLVVLRGWPGYQCPICSRQVGGLIADADKFKKHGANILMVYPGPSDKLQQYAAEFSEGFNFPEHFYFVFDPDYSMINKYGLRWDAPKETANPSTFVIDRNGKIVFSKVSETHGGRAESSEIIRALNDL